MFRSGASRSILRSLNTSPIVTTALGRQQLRSQLCTVARRPVAAATLNPLASKTLGLARWQSRDERPTVNKIDTKREDEIRHKELKPTPETVSASSTFSETSMSVGATTVDSEEAEPQMMKGIYGDLVCYAEMLARISDSYHMGLYTDIS